ncbi:1-acyl-sn-glycerol-3-phosphate acyltransferase [Polyangium jinanense]|uniref:1-acyl-sn-glycerol-3-phosphate acyltransferase n=1 Tax=Polyangium jinanense TaxID=2829994 RepID=A0A9X3X2S0_9BACT|nr:1-acyl-sn-glycerol-3-phosphate acyltransferase [Polyangium jinanense]MDC3952692.1 1-acyl-sn-glycerol-3-phosphate acyltransferase [Polyangium jinanense]MDC3980311.1 1-acyl-sn-glycerol-3-phosphate acyltransferase [Polyangium jinanense]
MTTAHAADLAEVLHIARAEMAGHLAKDRGPLAHRAAAWVLHPAALALAKNLVAFDHDLARLGSLRRASLGMLDRYGVRARILDASGGLHDLAARRAALPERGPLLIVSNHPGLYDALALFSAVGRDDLAVIAAARDLLFALPHVRKHLLSAPPDARAGLTLRTAARHLTRGGALLHFPAGRIEPDPRLVSPGESALHAFQPGLDALLALASRARPDLVVVPVIVSGVVSLRARAVASALAGRAGLTDAFVPLLQLTLPGFDDVDVRVTIGPELDVASLGAEPSALLREALERLARDASHPPGAAPAEPLR